jgi:hypothetical protein
VKSGLRARALHVIALMMPSSLSLHSFPRKHEN